MTPDERTDATLEQSESPGLTDWTKEPTVADFIVDMTAAQSDHDIQESRVDTWLDNLHVTGSAKLDKVAGRSNIQPKTIRKQAEWRYASLSEPFLSTDDVFNIDPVTYEDKAAAEQNALILNNQFNTKLPKVKFIDEYVRTAVDEGTVVVRVGWDNQEEEYEDSVPVFRLVRDGSPDIQEMHAKLHELMENSPHDYMMLPEEVRQAHDRTMEEGVGYRPEDTGENESVTKTDIIRNQPTLDICHYKNLLIDPTALGDMDKAQFVIHDFETSISDLEKDGSYSNLDDLNIESVGTVVNTDTSNSDDSSFNFKDEARKRFTAHEYWGYWDIDGDGETTPIVAVFVGNTMIKLEKNPYPDGKLPFVLVKFLPVRRSNFGEPDGELIKDSQDIIGAVYRGMVDIMGKSANGQVGSRKDALDTTNKRKFDNDEDYEYNAHVSPTDAFHVHTYGEIPNSAQLMLQLQNAEADSLTGVQAFSNGISGQALGTTATGIRSALDATSKRELGILRRLAAGITEIGRKIIAMNGEFLDDIEVVRVTNSDFIQVKRDDLAGNFDLRLTISTAEADNQKAEELSFMLQTTAQSMGQEFTQLILSDIAKLRKMPALAKRILEFAPKPDPLAVKRQELEIQLLEAQIRNELGKATENEANGKLDTAKVINDTKSVDAKVALDNAKALNLQSDTDLKNLEYVEQESGTAHERELDKQGQQARANMDLKVTEAALNKSQEKSTDTPT